MKRKTTLTPFLRDVLNRVRNPEIVADEHRKADAKCGRCWTCQCAACRTVRGKDKKR